MKFTELYEQKNKQIDEAIKKLDPKLKKRFRENIENTLGLQPNIAGYHAVKKITNENFWPNIIGDDPQFEGDKELMMEYVVDVGEKLIEHLNKSLEQFWKKI